MAAMRAPTCDEVKAAAEQFTRGLDKAGHTSLLTARNISLLLDLCSRSGRLVNRILRIRTLYNTTTTARAGFHKLAALLDKLASATETLGVAERLRSNSQTRVATLESVLEDLEVISATTQLEHAAATEKVKTIASHAKVHAGDAAEIGLRIKKLPGMVLPASMAGALKELMVLARSMQPKCQAYKESVEAGTVTAAVEAAFYKLVRKCLKMMIAAAYKLEAALLEEPGIRAAEAIEALLNLDRLSAGHKLILHTLNLSTAALGGIAHGQVVDGV